MCLPWRYSTCTPLVTFPRNGARAPGAEGCPYPYSRNQVDSDSLESRRCGSGRGVSDPGHMGH